MCSSLSAAGQQYMQHHMCGSSSTGSAGRQRPTFCLCATALGSAAYWYVSVCVPPPPAATIAAGGGGAAARQVPTRMGYKSDCVTTVVASPGTTKAPTPPPTSPPLIIIPRIRLALRLYLPARGHLLPLLPPGGGFGAAMVPLLHLAAACGGGGQARSNSGRVPHRGCGNSGHLARRYESTDEAEAAPAAADRLPGQEYHTHATGAPSPTPLHPTTPTPAPTHPTHSHLYTRTPTAPHSPADQARTAPPPLTCQARERILQHSPPRLLLLLAPPPCCSPTPCCSSPLPPPAAEAPSPSTPGISPVPPCTTGAGPPAAAPPWVGV